MIYDCFTFFNEVDLAELRFDIMDKYVDKFVIAEADTTHSGLAKPYYFEENYGRFKKWEDKIIYLKVTGLPRDDNRWLAENAQRDALHQALNPKAWVLISDLDEIPAMETWNVEEGVFVQMHSYYKINRIVRRPWKGTVAMRGWRFFSPYGRITPQDCRNFRDVLLPCGNGWHFSWLGNAEEKVKAFAHGELETMGWKKDDSKSPGENLPLETVRLTDVPFPYAVMNDRLKYHKWIASEEAV